MVTKQYFRPISDLPVHPGEMLEEEIDFVGMTQQELARRMGRPPQVVNEIIRGKKSVTHDTAVELEKVLGVPAHMWTNLQSTYNFTLARQKERDQWMNQAQDGWLDKFPVREIEKRGWINRYREKADKVGALLEFLGFASFDAWDKHGMEPILGFRISENSKVSPGALATWLRKGEIDGRNRNTSEYDERAFRDAITQIRTMTSDSPGEFVPKMTNLCAETGVAVVFIPELSKSGANGVARWITPNKGLIQMSLKGKWSDIFWFSFFHECCHILDHKVRDVHIDGINGASKSQSETSADEFAANSLIPPKEWERFLQAERFDAVSVSDFASDIDIHAGIVVGRMQYEGLLRHNRLTHLKSRYQWT